MDEVYEKANKRWVLEDGTVDTESPEWKLVEAMAPEVPDAPWEDEVSGELLHSQTLSFRTTIDLLFERYPRIPDFGLFHLNLADAADLISRDLSMTRHGKFGEVRRMEMTLEEREQRIEAIRKPIAKTIERHLISAVRKGVIPAFHEPGTIADFLEAESDAVLSRCTFVRYSNLLLWLSRGGYLELRSVDSHWKLGEYAFQEYALALEIEKIIKVKRNGQKKESVSPGSAKFNEFGRVTGPVAVPMKSSLLTEAHDRIEHLERELARAQDLIAARQVEDLNRREKDSLLKILGALLEDVKGRNRSVNLTSSVEAVMRCNGVSLDNKTINKWVTLAEKRIEFIKRKSPGKRRAGSSRR